MNDLWYVGNGYWMLYVENRQLIKEFNEMKELTPAAEYFYYNRRGLKAKQFTFSGGKELLPDKCLLHFVCVRAGFDFMNACSLRKKVDGIWPSYKELYRENPIQLEFLEMQLSHGKGSKKI